MVAVRKIHLLDSETINQIAAGEVIESAVSVVKELIENALDAGANEIEVETLGGGQGMIVVKDNGLGISKEDIPFALQKHATSKIHKFSDLFSLNSFGFRGEALSAIASISKMEIITAVEGAEAIKVRVHGGEIVSSEVCVRQRGTTMCIHDLFYNVPVRRNFQKSSQSNRMAIKKLIENQILVTQGVKWTWLNERRHELSSSKQQSFADKVAAILGDAFVKGAFLLDCQDENGMSILGYFGAPYEHRPTRQGQRIFINNRPIDSVFISNKILDAYSFLLPPQRHPLFVVNIQLPPHWCDFNVHPRKTEVRLLKTEKIGPWLFKKVSEALLTANFESSDSCSSVSEEFKMLQPQKLDQEPFVAQDSLDGWHNMVQNLEVVSTVPQLESREALSHFSSDAPYSIEKTREPTKPHQQLHMCWEEKLSVRFLTAVNTVLLVEDHEGLHAVFSENARKHLFYLALSKENVMGSSQHFLIPVQISVTVLERDFILAHLEYLKSVGLDLVQIAPCSFAIHGAPACIHEDELKAWFLLFVSEGIRQIEDQTIDDVITISLKKIVFRKTKKNFDPDWLNVLWMLGKPEKGLDGSVIRKKLEEEDFLFMLKDK